MNKLERARAYVIETLNGSTASDSNRRRWIAWAESIFILAGTATVSPDEREFLQRLPAFVGFFLLFGEGFRQDYLLGKREKTL